MKRYAIVGLVLALAVGMVGGPVEAKRRRGKAKPVKTTLYMHGSEVIGEVESPPADSIFLPMDTTKPEGSEPKSKQMINYLGGPNTDCAGNTLFPVWTGDLRGQVKGTMKLAIGAVTTPTTVEVRVWPDVSSLLCNSSLGGNDYVEPAATFTIDLLPGMNKAKVKGVNFKAVNSVMVQVTPTSVEPVISPSFTRIVYDSTDFPTSITFKCVPAKGNKCA